MKPATCAWLQKIKDPRRLVIYAYLGQKQLAVLQPVLLALVCRGARVVTYMEHMELTGKWARSIVTTDAYDGVLTCYRRNEELYQFEFDDPLAGVIETRDSLPVSTRSISVPSSARPAAALVKKDRKKRMPWL